MPNPCLPRLIAGMASPRRLSIFLIWRVFSKLFTTCSEIPCMRSIYLLDWVPYVFCLGVCSKGQTSDKTRKCYYGLEFLPTKRLNSFLICMHIFLHMYCTFWSVRVIDSITSVKMFALYSNFSPQSKAQNMESKVARNTPKRLLRLRRQPSQ